MMIRHAHVWDAVLRFFDRPVVQRTNLVLVVLLITGVLLISCLTLGWHNLCHQPDECEVRDRVFIAAVHVVNSIADLLILSVLPWRIIQTRHALTGHGLGCDWHGNKSNFVFFKIPHRRRKCIMILLLLNASFHYSNHILRIVCYRTYNAHIRMPGLLITNILVACSVTCLFSAHIWITWECWWLAKKENAVLGKKELYAHVRRMKRHYPLDGDDEDDYERKSDTSVETPCESFASQIEDDFDEDELHEDEEADMASVDLESSIHSLESPSQGEDVV